MKVQCHEIKEISICDDGMLSYSVDFSIAV